MLHLGRYLYRLHSADFQNKNVRSLPLYSTSIQKRTKSDSFAAHFEQHFKTTTSRTDLHKYMTFKVVKQINLIGALKTFTKPNCILFIEERLTFLKNICEDASQL